MFSFSSSFHINKLVYETTIRNQQQDLVIAVTAHELINPAIVCLPGNPIVLYSLLSRKFVCFVVVLFHFNTTLTERSIDVRINAVIIPVSL